jgi:hypothetical protein
MKVTLRPMSARRDAIMQALLSQFGDGVDRNLSAINYSVYTASIAEISGTDWQPPEIRDCFNFDAVMENFEAYLDGPGNDDEFITRLDEEVRRLREPADPDFGPEAKPDPDPKAGGGD